MPRVARIVIPDCPHPITQRGNNRQDVFFLDDDRDTYFGLLLEEAEKHGLSVEGYCLMTNPIHLILSKIEPLVGRRLRALPVGRRRKGKQ